MITYDFIHQGKYASTFSLLYQDMLNSCRSEQKVQYSLDTVPFLRLDLNIG